jgi:hypothetical protein
MNASLYIRGSTISSWASTVSMRVPVIVANDAVSSEKSPSARAPGGPARIGLRPRIGPTATTSTSAMPTFAVRSASTMARAGNPAWCLCRGPSRSSATATTIRPSRSTQPTHRNALIPRTTGMAEKDGRITSPAANSLGAPSSDRLSS